MASSSGKTQWNELPALPEVVEHSSESMWAQFEAISQGLDGGFARTVPVSLAPPLEPAPVAAPASAGGAPADAPAPAAPATTLDQAVAEARRLNRVCPKPPQWKQFHALLPRQGEAAAPPPLEGRAWHDTPSVARRLVLREQLAWAEATGCLDTAMQFLRALPESDWHHVGD